MSDELNTIMAELRTRLELLEEYKGTGYVPDMIRKMESNANRLADELIKAREYRDNAIEILRSIDVCAKHKFEIEDAISALLGKGELSDETR
jgi:hypothetical protein